MADEVENSPVCEIEGVTLTEEHIGRRVRVIPQHVYYGFKPGYPDITQHPDCWTGVIVGFRELIGYSWQVKVQGDTGEAEDVAAHLLRWS